MMQQTMSHSELIRIVLGLFSVLALILVLSWVVKRVQATQFHLSKGFKVIASMALGPKEKVMLLQVGARYLLLGVGSGQITLLYDFGNELPSGFDEAKKSSFAELFKSVVVT